MAKKIEEKTGAGRGPGRPTVADGGVAVTRNVTVDNDNWSNAKSKATLVTGLPMGVSELIRRIGRDGVVTPDGGLYVPPVDEVPRGV